MHRPLTPLRLVLWSAAAPVGVVALGYAVGLPAGTCDGLGWGCAPHPGSVMAPIAGYLLLPVGLQAAVAAKLLDRERLRPLAYLLAAAWALVAVVAGAAGLLLIAWTRT